MNLSEQLILYCERQGPGFTAEPLNALSNFAFFYWAWRLWRDAGRAPALKLPLRCLAGLMLLVGVGSLSFHTFATAWARIFDLAFIGVFNVLYLVFFLRAAIGWSRLRVGLAAFGFLLLDRAAAMVGISQSLQGSGTYLPAVMVLLALDAYALLRVPPAGRMMAGATIVFLVSLAARTVDQVSCGIWPWGTHFVWHVLNAWVLYRLSLSLLLATRAR